jgi:DNA-binding PadR family transcriptional regulator
MQAIEERSEGLWRPSPGSVYPTLAQLEDEGLIRSADTEGARRFEITDAGRQHLDSRADESSPWESGERSADNPLAELAPLASVGTPAQREDARALLEQTRKTLYRILAGDGREGGDEDDR